MDKDALREIFGHYTEGQSTFTRRAAINMADYFGMKPMSLVWQLEKNGLLKRGAWDWFKSNGGITAAHINEARAAQSQETPHDQE